MLKKIKERYFSDWFIIKVLFKTFIDTSSDYMINYKGWWLDIGVIFVLFIVS